MHRLVHKVQQSYESKRGALKVVFMEQYQIGNAIVRVHGTCDPDNLQKATARFLKQVETHRKKARNEARKNANEKSTSVASKVET